MAPEILQSNRIPPRTVAGWSTRLMKEIGHLCGKESDAIEHGNPECSPSIDHHHSPYGFHTRVMGFDPVATHDHGELQCASRRITMVLDLKAAYQRLRRRRGWIFRALTSDWDERLHQRLAV